MPSADKWHWKDRANRAIAHGALTNSKRPASLVEGVYPSHLVRGQGPYVWDHLNNKYIDFIGANGTNLFGYGNQILGNAIRRRFDNGSLLSLGTALEVEAAEKIKSIIPFIDRLRFLKSGSEACTAALTIARAATGRKLVLSDGYHGWHPEFVSLTPPANGVAPGQGLHIEALKDFAQITSKVAAVIVEPVNLDYSRERIEYLKRLRQACDEAGALLIFDEVITGFRFPKWCVAQWSGVYPDLICLGKAIGGGLPLAIVGGGKDVMECENQYFVSSTYSGETLSLEACMYAIDLLSGRYPIADLWDAGAQWLEKFNAVAPEVIRIEGYPTRGVVVGEEKNKALFFQEACRAGFLFGPSWFYSFAHRDIKTLHALEEIIWKIKTRPPKLLGKMPRSPFAAKVRKSQSP